MSNLKIKGEKWQVWKTKICFEVCSFWTCWQRIVSLFIEIYNLLIKIAFRWNNTNSPKTFALCCMLSGQNGHILPIKLDYSECCHSGMMKLWECEENAKTGPWNWCRDEVGCTLVQNGFLTVMLNAQLQLYNKNLLPICEISFSFFQKAAYADNFIKLDPSELIRTWGLQMG